jgi:hypothetical protein
MERIMPGFAQPEHQSTGELSVDEKSHGRIRLPLTD